MQRRNGRTPEDDFKTMILVVLYAKKSSVPTWKVVEIVRTILEANGMLRPLDFELLSSDQKRYYNTCCWARKQLKDDGYLRRDSRHGQWELSEKGRIYMESQIKTERVRKLLATWRDKNQALRPRTDHGGSC
ncbi:MAG: winged helix-turn-helix domain-containing protein [Calditrichaeota bacterium]|nr:winged helix-turn-helix domain-containing protein [Calditrichota bacterium]